MAEFWQSVQNFLGKTGVRVVLAFIALFLGLFLIKVVTRLSKNSLHKTPLERTTVSFIISILHFVLYLLLAYIVADIIFPDLSAGLIAALGSAAIAIGLALKDSLASFANGVIIIFTKPFKEGDYISVGSNEGTVIAIGLLSTTIHSGDNKKIVISNSSIVSGVIINYSNRPTRRIDLDICAAYGSDIEKVKQVLTDLAKNHPLVLTEPEPLVRLYKHGESELIFRYRVWVKNCDYWTVYYDLMEQSITEFQKNGIEVPYNHLTINISKADKEDKI